VTTNKEQNLQSSTKVFQVCSLFNEKSEQFKNTKVTSELVVDVQPKEISIALLEDKALVEFQKEGRSASFNVGNMYLGRVKKLMPGLNACFVDVGFEKDAFLHYLDLGPQFHSYQKYLKQVLSDLKKLFSFTICTITS
jgi:ribonuclease G